MQNQSSILWKRLDTEGHDSASLADLGDQWLLHGTAVFDAEGQAARLDYRIRCDHQWKLVDATIDGWFGETVVAHRITVDDDRRWFLDGVVQPAVEGCDDLDLEFTPATNVFPVRRLAMPIGAKANVRPAWFRVPGFTLEPLEQTYERLGAESYAYNAPSLDFSGVLKIGANGFIRSYMGLWVAVTK